MSREERQGEEGGDGGLRGRLQMADEWGWFYVDDKYREASRFSWLSHN